MTRLGEAADFRHGGPGEQSGGRNHGTCRHFRRALCAEKTHRAAARSPGCGKLLDENSIWKRSSRDRPALSNDRGDECGTRSCSIGGRIRTLRAPLRPIQEDRTARLPPGSLSLPHACRGPGSARTDCQRELREAASPGHLWPRLNPSPTTATDLHQVTFRLTDIGSARPR